MKWKPYPAYKDSGVEWFGKLPNEWNVTKVRYISDCLDGRRVPLNAEQRADKQGDVPYWGANSIVDYVDEALFDEKLALLGEDGAPFFDRDKPVAFVSNGPVWPNNHVHILRIKPVEATSYVVYALNSVDYSGYIDGSTRDKLTQGQMNAIPLPWPDTELATKIATFLDRETAKLDTLISKQEHLIELLQEKRQAIISHAVTKGLDPDAPMKDSGIEWLGEVPEHWEINRTKFLFEIVKSISGSNGHEVLSITQSGIKVKDIESGEGQLSDDYSKYQYVKIGDFAMNHMDLLTGYVDISKFDGVTSPDYRVFRIRDKSSSLSEYFLHLFQLAYKRKIYYNLGQGVSNLGRWRLPTDEFNNFKLPLPPFAEQVEICQYLGIQTNKIDLLINKARQSIDLAKEHRSALISAAVTGKIDVREAA